MIKATYKRKSLFGTHGSMGLEFMMAEWSSSSLQVAGGAAEYLHLKPQAGNRELALKGRVLKPQSPLARPYLLHLLKQPLTGAKHSNV